jgi:hypothetical protein
MIIKKYLIIALIIILILPLGRIAFVFCLYHINSINTPHVLVTVKETLKMIEGTQYLDLRDKTVYKNETEYNRIKTRIIDTYSAEIVDWDAGGDAYVDLTLRDGNKYQLLVVPDSYWYMKFKVFLFREASNVKK